MKTRMPVITLIMFVSIFSWRKGETQEVKKTVVFVCEHGGARSTIASAYFNKLAKEHNLPYQSVFRAIVPDSTISKETRAGLTADGFATASLVPTALTSKDTRESTLLISIDCSMPTSYHVDQVWRGVPAISQDYAKARNEILKHLDKLIEELKKKK
ncbi:MAG: hypothetical protein K2U26_09990 [Cyclobacteriaceae bacterium]|nr:hypothetical protein [Cyclobacteriaceae bacterium]